MVRKVIASRTPSPGPGHYQGLSIVALRHSQSHSPTRTGNSSGGGNDGNTSHDDPLRACPSPGYRGYSFGKSKLQKYVELETDQPVFELKQSLGNTNGTTYTTYSAPNSPSVRGSLTPTQHSRNNSQLSRGSMRSTSSYIEI